MKVIKLDSIADLLDSADPRIVVLQPVVVEVRQGDNNNSDHCPICGRRKHPDAKLCVTCAHQLRESA